MLPYYDKTETCYFPISSKNICILGRFIHICVYITMTININNYILLYNISIYLTLYNINLDYCHLIG